MGTYFPPLNLTLDADERAVKRAYAAALKETRPDDDPAAFQALVAARDRALDWVKRRRVLSAGSLDTLDNLQPRPSSVPPDTAGTDAVATAHVDDAIEPDPLATAIDHTALEETAAPQPMPRSGPSPIVSLPMRTLLEPSFAVMVRSQQVSQQVLSVMAISLIRDEANSVAINPAERWEALLMAAEELDLSGRMALERTITIELDTVMQEQAAVDPALIDVFAATVLRLDRSFRWSEDLRRVVRILGEPSATHPLVFAVERFGETAVRLRVSADGFPIIPDCDLIAWFGSADQGGARAYRRAARTGRFGFGWSWYAFLSPPAWGVRMGLWPWGLGFALASVAAVYALFDPITDVGSANSFATFLALLISVRLAIAVAAPAIETLSLVRILKRIEAGSLPTLAERRRRIASSHGSKLLNVIVGLFFLLLVDGYCLQLVIQAMSLRSSLVADMIVVPDRKTPGVTFADRIVAESYLDHAREIAEAIDDLVRQDKVDPPNPLRHQRIDRLQQRFLALIRALPIGNFAPEFADIRAEIARLQRH